MRADEKGTCGKEKTSHLSYVGSNSVGRGKMREKKKKKKRRKRGVRSSTFSLDFTEIGPSVFIGVRGKVRLCDESFAWIREYEVFSKLREVGVSLLLWLLLV